MDNSKKYIAIEADAQNWEEAIKLCGEALIANNCIGQGLHGSRIVRNGIQFEEIWIIGYKKINNS